MHNEKLFKFTTSDKNLIKERSLVKFKEIWGKEEAVDLPESF